MLPLLRPAAQLIASVARTLQSYSGDAELAAVAAALKCAAALAELIGRQPALHQVLGLQCCIKLACTAKECRVLSCVPPVMNYCMHQMSCMQDARSAGWCGSDVLIETGSKRNMTRQDAFATLGFLVRPSTAVPEVHICRCIHGAECLLTATTAPLGCAGRLARRAAAEAPDRARRLPGGLSDWPTACGARHGSFHLQRSRLARQRTCLALWCACFPSQALPWWNLVRADPLILGKCTRVRVISLVFLYLRQSFLGGRGNSQRVHWSSLHGVSVVVPPVGRRQQSASPGLRTRRGTRELVSAEHSCVSV